MLAPLADAAELLAQRDSCGRTCTTRPGSGPARCRRRPAVYFNDMYVPLEFSLPTAQAIGGTDALGDQ